MKAVKADVKFEKIKQTKTLLIQFRLYYILIRPLVYRSIFTDEYYGLIVHAKQYSSDLSEVVNSMLKVNVSLI